MDNKQEDYLIQKITVRGQEIDRAFLKEITYVETIDLSGPRLMMRIDDPYRILRDDMKVRERDELEIVIADRWLRDGIDRTIKFVIMTMPVENNMVHFNCFEKTVMGLKVPAKEAILFPQKPVTAILTRLIPGGKYDVGSFPVIEDYHLVPGERPSRLLRQMARELGAVVFWRRGAVVFKKLKDLLAQPAKLTYHHDDRTQKNQIIMYTRSNARTIIRDRVQRNYMGWNMEQGMLRSGKKTNKPPELVSNASKPSLDNHLEIPVPAIDFTTAGSGYLMPGLPMKLVWNVQRLDAPIDESLPPKVVVGTVAHFYSTQKYFCRVLGVLPL